MQLGFDRQHFTLPRVGISLRLNKGPLATLCAIDTSGLAVSSYSNSWVKGLVTDQFHLVRIVEGCRHLGVA